MNRYFLFKGVPFRTLLLVAIVSQVFFCKMYSQTLGPWVRTPLDPESSEMTDLVVIDDILFASGFKGLWKKERDSEEWTKLITLPYANSLIKHKGSYYIAAGGDGLWTSRDLVEWTQIPLEGYAMVAVVTDQERLYCGTNGGVFILNEDSFILQKEPLESQSIHNSFFPHLLMTEDYLLAFGCSFAYYKHKDSTNWHTIDYQYGYCGITAEYIDGIVYFSSSGDGIYSFIPGEFIVSPLTAEYASDLRHVISIYSKDEVIYFLFLDGLYSSENIREDINGNILTDMVFHEGGFYVSTSDNGVWKSTGTIPRSSKDISFEFTATPSPSAGEILLTLDHVKDQSYMIEVFDIQGRRIHSHSLENQYNLFTMNYTVDIQTPGQYFIACTSKDGRHIEKVVVIE